MTNVHKRPATSTKRGRTPIRAKKGPWVFSFAPLLIADSSRCALLHPSSATDILAAFALEALAPVLLDRLAVLFAVRWFRLLPRRCLQPVADLVCCNRLISAWHG